MPSTAFLHAGNKRLTLLGRQALGVASLNAGSMDVILDRRLSQDDDRGLGQGVLDNKQTESRFRLQLEAIQRPPNWEQTRNGFLSASAIRWHHSLHYPLVILFGQLDSATSAEVPSSWSALKKPLPCDVHLFAIRTGSEPTVYSLEGKRSTSPKEEASMIFHRHGVECLAAIVEDKRCENTNGKVRFFCLSSMFTQFLARLIRLLWVQLQITYPNVPDRSLWGCIARSRTSNPTNGTKSY
jgi:alpha-mannosidase II